MFYARQAKLAIYCGDGRWDEGASQNVVRIRSSRLNYKIIYMNKPGGLMLFINFRCWR